METFKKLNEMLKITTNICPLLVSSCNLLADRRLDPWKTFSTKLLTSHNHFNITLSSGDCFEPTWRKYTFNFVYNLPPWLDMQTVGVNIAERTNITLPSFSGYYLPQLQMPVTQSIARFVTARPPPLSPHFIRFWIPNNAKNFTPYSK
jgi:hypothetical protein